MSRALLIARLAVRDVRRRPAQAILMLLAITAATTVLSLALALHGVTSKPYQQTRAATKGPDVVALLDSGGVFTGPHVPSRASQMRQIEAQARSLITAHGVTAHAGLYPVASVILQLGKVATQVQAEGRDQAPAVLDQPKLTAGRWVRPDGIVLERTFAESLGARVGDRVTLNGRPYTVAGIAVTAASAPYPNLCFPPGGTCVFDYPMNSNGSRVWVFVGKKQVTLSTDNIGLAWVTESDARALATAAAPVSYLLDLKLRDPATAQQFVSSYQSAHAGPANGPGGPGPGRAALVSWQSIAYNDGLLVQDEQQVLTPGALLLALLAIASVAVLVGGRMSEQASRVGVLKAVGASPGLVALVLLAENVVLALAAAVVGLLAGWLAAPLITSPGAALLGAPGAPSVTAADVGLVIGVALLVALASTLVPGIRASRVSTVSSLAEQVRAPRRRPRLIALSRRLPAPLLLGVRVIARRPRRAVLTAASVAVTVAGIVAVLTFHATADARLGASTSAVSDPVVDRDEQMLVVLTVALVTLAALNALVTAWSTVLETRASSALTRALGASPRQLGAGLAMAQAVPALPGALLGIPLGLGLFAIANGGGTAATVIPPAWWLAAAVLCTVLAVLVLAAIPARIEQRLPIAPVLTEA
jgi:ABC-type lipoprotein release transport system permease subunit